VQYDINDYYAANFPGQVQVLGCDIWNGSSGQLATYRSQTFATYPLLRTCSDLYPLYGINYDNYFVVDQNGVIRYISPYLNQLGERYDVNAIRAAINALVVTSVGEDVPRDDAHAPRGATLLSVTPSVVRNAALVSVTGAHAPDAIRIVDLKGREVRRLPLVDGRARWDTRDTSGRDAPAGVYVAVAPDGAVARRFVVTR
jgi:hypothetical protein